MEAKISLDGFVEVWDGVRYANIRIWEEDWSVYINGDLYDGFDTFEEFLNYTGGKVYKSLVDYKKDQFVDLRDLVEKSNWKEIPWEDK